MTEHHLTGRGPQLTRRHLSGRHDGAPHDGAPHDGAPHNGGATWRCPETVSIKSNRIYEHEITLFLQARESEDGITGLHQITTQIDDRGEIQRESDPSDSSRFIQSNSFDETVSHEVLISIIHIPTFVLDHASRLTSYISSCITSHHASCHVLFLNVVIHRVMHHIMQQVMASCIIPCIISCMHPIHRAIQNVMHYVMLHSMHTLMENVIHIVMHYVTHHPMLQPMHKMSRFTLSDINRPMHRPMHLLAIIQSSMSCNSPCTLCMSWHASCRAAWHASPAC